MYPVILVTGASGLTGFHVMRVLAGKARAIGLRCFSPPVSSQGEWRQVDLRRRGEVDALLERERPDGVIHCAAISDTSYCELHPQEAWDVNFGATDHLARALARIPAFLVHVSTDLVFGGEGSFYKEEDPVGPISLYGRTKLAAEQLLFKSGLGCSIVRTALVYGRSPQGHHSVNEKLADQWSRNLPTPLFVDEYRTPTAVGDLAAALVEFCQRKLSGIYHLAGVDRVSRFELGLKIAATLGYSEELVVPRKIAEVKSVPPRAHEVSLDVTKARGILQCRFSSLEEGLRRELA